MVTAVVPRHLVNLVYEERNEKYIDDIENTYREETLRFHPST